MSAGLHVLEWLCEQLVRALLGGVWLLVCQRRGAAYDRAFHRFTALVDAAPCWPCRIDYGPRSGPLAGWLFILAGEAAEYARMEAEGEWP